MQKTRSVLPFEQGTLKKMCHLSSKIKTLPESAFIFLAKKKMISMFSLIVASKLSCWATGGETHPSCSTPNFNSALLRWTPGVGAERWEHWLALVHRWCVGVLLRCCTGAHALQQLVFQHSCKVRPFSSQRAALVSTVWRVWSRSGACRGKKNNPQNQQLPK